MAVTCLVNNAACFSCAPSRSAYVASNGYYLPVANKHRRSRAFFLANGCSTCLIFDSELHTAPMLGQTKEAAQLHTASHPN